MSAANYVTILSLGRHMSSEQTLGAQNLFRAVLRPFGLFRCCDAQRILISSVGPSASDMASGAGPSPAISSRNLRRAARRSARPTRLAGGRRP